MSVKTKARRKMAKAKQTNRIVWVWGTSKKGIAVERSAHKSKGKYWWDILHVKDGKVVLVHTDYRTKTEAIREAKSYAHYEKAHPRSGFIW